MMLTVDLSPLGSHLAIDRTKHQDANRQSTSIESQQIHLSQQKLPDFSFTLNLNSFCQSCLAPNLQLFTAKPQHPRCSQSESWDGPHQPPYEHPKSVINNKNLGSCGLVTKPNYHSFFLDFWVSMVFFATFHSSPSPPNYLPTEFLGSKGNKLSKRVRRASTVDRATRWRPGQNQMSYWWWLKSGDVTSWGKGSFSHYLQDFSTIPGGCLGVLPSTVGAAMKMSMKTRGKKYHLFFFCCWFAF